MQEALFCQALGLAAPWEVDRVALDVACSRIDLHVVWRANTAACPACKAAYCQGALALELYCARLVDEHHTADGVQSDDARLLLEVLTPIAKSWPSEWCLEANSLASQIHGGYGYTRDFPDWRLAGCGSFT